MRSGGKTLFKKKNKQVCHALVSQKKNIHKKKKGKREERKEKILKQKQKQGPIQFPNIRSVFIYSACLYVAGTF